jgi:hypothetical protein
VEEATVNPFVMVLLFILRCLVPLGLLLAVSYLLRRLGLIAEPTKPPAGWNNGAGNGTPNNGGSAHEQS